MKYYRIDLQHVDGPSTPLIYPDNYQVLLGNKAVDHLYYSDKGDPRLVLVIPDQYEPTSLPAGVTELNENQIKVISEGKEKRTEKCRDEVKLRRIELMARLNRVITQEDLNAIDPAHADYIFGSEKILADRIDDHKGDWDGK